jgi:hypothetical protein
MRRIAIALVVALLVWPALADDDKPKDKAKEKPDPGTLTSQYQALVEEYQEGIRGIPKAYGEATTDEERQKILEKQRKHPDKMAKKFLALAASHPKDAVALDSLVWIVSHDFLTPAGPDSPRTTAIDLLLRDHVRSDRLGDLCPMMALMPNPANEKFLRALLEKSPHKSARGLACLALGQALKMRADAIRSLKAPADSETAKTYEEMLGKEFARELQGKDPEPFLADAEKLFEQAGAEYADVKIAFPFEGVVGEKAKSELFEVRFLSIGKTAPEIEGKDQDGRTFKLSDYRGKIVMLDFWSRN